MEPAQAAGRSCPISAGEWSWPPGHAPGFGTEIKLGFCHLSPKPPRTSLMAPLAIEALNKKFNFCVKIKAMAYIVWLLWSHGKEPEGLTPTCK